MSALPERQGLVEMVKQANQAGARLAAACGEVGMSVRTFERWTLKGEVRGDARPDAVRPEPSHKLSEAEREHIVRLCHEPRFADLPPSQIVPRLADEGRYVASESSFYRVLRAQGEQQRRGRAAKPVASEPSRHLATGPNTVWVWDITFLACSKVVGKFFYLYAILDLWSRKIVAWEVHERESGELAAELVEKAVWREHLRLRPLILHADNGAAPTAYTLKAKLEALGIRPSHSRPGVSDDNAHIEAWFRTAKYRPGYPTRGFADLEAARAWALKLVNWYNGEHRHSAIGFVTPSERHSGEAPALFSKRRRVYEAARARNPGRWSRGVRWWKDPDQVWLNPPPKSSLHEKAVA
jgi:transposase InsO family protein